MKLEKAIFACGCFWGAQHQFERAKGVIRSEVGYIGGDKENPTYQEVKAHTTGHAEATLVNLQQRYFRRHRLRHHQSRVLLRLWCYPTVYYSLLKRQSHR